MARTQFPREFIGRNANLLVPIHLMQSKLTTTARTALGQKGGVCRCSKQAGYTPITDMALQRGKCSDGAAQ